MKCLLTFRGLAHDPQRILAAVEDGEFDQGTSRMRPIAVPFVFLMSAVFPFASMEVTT